MIARVVLAVALGVVLPAGAVDAQTAKAGVVTTLEGTVSARRLAGPVSLKYKDDVFVQDTVSTGEKSLARMLLGGKAVVTVRERSTLTITEAPGRSTVDLDSGKFALVVAREKMRPGEEILIRTPNAVAAVRGTVVITEVDRRSAAPVVTSFYVLRGTITAQPFDPGTNQPLGTPVAVGTLQGYSGTGTATPRVAPIPPDQVAQITAGLQPTGPRGGGDVAAQQVKEQAMGTAVQLVGALGRAVLDRTPVLIASAPIAARGVTEAPLIPPITDALASTTQPASAQAPAVSADTSATTPTASSAPADSTPPAQSAPPPGDPEFLVTGAVTLGAGQTVATFDAAKTRTLTSPEILITGSGASVTKSGSDAVIQVSGAGAVSLASPLLRVADAATVTTTNPTLNTLAGTAAALGNGPVAVAITPDGARAYIASRSAGTLTVLNTATNAIVTTISLSQPNGIAISPDGTRAYVSDEGSDAIKVISTATNTVIATLQSFINGRPEGIAISPDGTRVYLATANTSTGVQVIDTATNTLVANIPGNACGTPGCQSRRLAISPDGSRLYVTEASGGNDVRVIATATNTTVTTIPVGTNPFGIAVSRDGTRVYVANTGSNTVSVINTGNNTVERTISVASSPTGVALTPDGTRLIVTNSGSSTLTVIGTATNTVLTTITVGTSPADVAVTSDGTRAIVVRGSTGATAVAVDLSSGAPLLTVAAGGSITSTTTDALIQFASSTVTVGAELVRLSGRTTATATEVADGVTLTLGTDQPVTTGGPLIEAVGATVSAQKAIVLDTALLAATAPLLNITAQSSFSTTFEAIDLVRNVKLTSVGPLVKLDASTLTVGGGSLIRVGGGSLLRVSGDLVQLANGSTLTLSNGPLLTASGKSVVNVSGALIAFGGSGGNVVNVTNSLCSGSCASFSGIPVFFSGGATSSQLSIGGNPIKGSSLGSIVPSGGSTALVVVDGPTTKVTITAP